MLEAVKLWNEPNNKSYWDIEFDRQMRALEDFGVTLTHCYAK